ncbi:WD repeats-containing protein [Cryptosporidium ubiquitum]|uniref:WD repeats-containing protein n=1 Tax=Cryptosporidium ubiquitum TaxID=857276 RepID=A0A1J4MND5_9CRYT|nr:WD repeats-containing protein [Cryptosporidium ubiquitum]OII75551.1 WD repeats-containing protein [Cryptosporidium ubiquitum]
MNDYEFEQRSLIIEKAFSKTPYVGYNLEPLNHSNNDEKKTYIALSNLNGKNYYVEVLIYDSENNDFEIGYLYDHIFSPVGGVHWMPRNGIGLEENILGTASDSIKLFKEGNLICDLRLNDYELNNMRLESVYNSYHTKITSFSFSEYVEGDIISSTQDGRCVIWDINESEQIKLSEGAILENLLSEYKNRSVLSISQMERFTIMDVCFGYSKDNIILGVNNGLAISMDLRSPFKQSSSLLSDCILGWDTIPEQKFPHIKLCCIKNTNYFSRGILSKGIVEIFDIRKTCGPLLKLNTTNSNPNSSENSLVSIESKNSEEILLAYSNGLINTYNFNKERPSIHLKFETNLYTYSFSSLNISKQVNSFLGISSVQMQNSTGIKISKYAKC